MLKKKICMLGAFGVGKTSMVSRFVHSVFSEDYLSTIGVKIDKKEVDLKPDPVSLVLWDLQGQDAYQSVRTSYLRGSAGIIYVMDGTRPETYDVALALREKTREAVGPLPSVLALNKADLEGVWARPVKIDWPSGDTFSTSAKTGTGVEDLFLHLALEMIDR
jgi:small GTP-binding protein